MVMLETDFFEVQFPEVYSPMKWAALLHHNNNKYFHLMDIWNVPEILI